MTLPYLILALGFAAYGLSPVLAELIRQDAPWHLLFGLGLAAGLLALAWIAAAHMLTGMA